MLNTAQRTAFPPVSTAPETSSKTSEQPTHARTIEITKAISLKKAKPER